MSGLRSKLWLPHRSPVRPKTADHLIGDQQHVVFLQHRLYFFEICRRWDDYSAGAHHRLGEKRRNSISPFSFDQRVQIVGAACRKILLTLVFFSVAVMMRAIGMQKTRDRQIESLVVNGRAGDAGRRDGDPVIAFDAADDLFLVRKPQRVVAVPDQLDGGVVGLRSRIGEKHL